MRGIGVAILVASAFCAGAAVAAQAGPKKADMPTFERDREFHASAEYVAARKVRDGAGQAQFVVVEGVE